MVEITAVTQIRFEKDLYHTIILGNCSWLAIWTTAQMVGGWTLFFAMPCIGYFVSQKIVKDIKIVGASNISVTSGA